MDFEFILPQGVIKEEVKEDYGRFVFSPLERGYGTTVGNALRRVLLSSIPGYAIIAARIDGVYHEFSTVDGILEDVPQIVLNLKKIRLKFDDTSREEATLIFKAEGKGVFTARNIELPDYVTIVNPDQHIATLTDDKARLYMELIARRGRGYLPSEEISKEGMPEGFIYIDGLFSPVTKVNFTVENVRVKARTDYEKLILEVWTDGTTTPESALDYAVDLLLDAFSRFKKETEAPKKVETVQFEEKEKMKTYLYKNIEFLELSKRTINCLRDAGITEVWQLLSKTEDELLQIKNFGEKSLREIQDKLEKFGLSLGIDVKKYMD